MSMKKVKRATSLWVTEGGYYYTRKWMNGRAKWVALGNDRETANTKRDQIKAGKRRVFTRVPVEMAVAEWLDTSIATSRNEKGQRLGRVRVDTYLRRFKDPK